METTSPMDAALTDSGVDAGPRDGSTMDATVDASKMDASTMCYSPLQVPDGGHAAGLSAPGCECIKSPSTSYCIAWSAVTCFNNQSGWSFGGVDGPCALTTIPDPVGSCQRLGGAQIAPGTACPSGFATQAYYRDSSADAGVGVYNSCCYPIEVPAQNCTQAGLTVLPAGPQSSLLATQCSNGGALRAFVVGQAAKSLCCAAP
jgi:hypothetical protein